MRNIRVFIYTFAIIALSIGYNLETASLVKGFAQPKSNHPLKSNTNIKKSQNVAYSYKSHSALISEGNPYNDPTVSPIHNEQVFIDLINKERSYRGIPVLKTDPLLTSIARSHSFEMYDLNYFDHHSPTATLKTPMDRFLKGVKEAGLVAPEYALVGENIYYSSIYNNQYDSAYGHKVFMNSPGHRANILDPRYKKVGVGTYEDNKGRFWVTEVFLSDVE